MTENGKRSITSIRPLWGRFQNGSSWRKTCKGCPSAYGSALAPREWPQLGGELPSHRLMIVNDSGTGCSIVLIFDFIRYRRTEASEAGKQIDCERWRKDNCSRNPDLKLMAVECRSKESCQRRNGPKKVGVQFVCTIKEPAARLLFRQVYLAAAAKCEAPLHEVDREAHK